MGVPVVSLAGDRPQGRMGASILAAAGCADWIASDAAQYVAVASRLSADPDGLRAVRAGLRSRLRASPLLDEERFTRNVEAALRSIAALRR